MAKDLSQSNAIQLTLKEWAVVGTTLAFMYAVCPVLWSHLETWQPTPSYRIPYASSHDYWQVERYWDWAGRCEGCLVVGDSVVWGEYVSPPDTLSAQMQQLTGKPFLNMGLNGSHPACMAGLIQWYGKNVRGKDVLLHFNPLWMSSSRHDLTESKEFRFNHPKLVPQFFPRIPCYKESLENKIGIVAQRFFWPSRWLAHLASVYFDELDLGSWIREHPTENPLSQIGFQLPVPEEEPRHPQRPWTESGVAVTSFDWVVPSESIQWRLFQRSVDILEDRGNRVFVLVGPFNVHMLAQDSTEGYERILEEATSWLERREISYLVASPLPKDCYGDASHPLPEGYRQLAREVLSAMEAQRMGGMG